MSLKERKVNAFDQHTINNFLGHHSTSQLLWYRMQKAIYTKYKQVWKQLLSFVYQLV
jgi:hypothetical protein